VLSLRLLLLLKCVLGLQSRLLLLKMLRQVYRTSHCRASPHRLVLRLCHLVHSIWHVDGHPAIMLSQHLLSCLLRCSLLSDHCLLLMLHLEVGIIRGDYDGMTCQHSARHNVLKNQEARNVQSILLKLLTRHLLLLLKHLMLLCSRVWVEMLESMRTWDPSTRWHATHQSPGLAYLGPSRTRNPHMHLLRHSRLTWLTRVMRYRHGMALRYSWMNSPGMW
jgi:hypothetical protein